MSILDSMSNTKIYRVTKCDSNRFTVDSGSEIFHCAATKKVKQSTGILPGDIVEIAQIAQNDAVPAIVKVFPRKNSLIRPLVANIDQVIAVAALVPKPDYFLIDKLIINANKQNIAVILCLNKSDLSNGLFLELTDQYSGIVNKIIVTSAIGDELSELLPLLNGKLSCFAGQSAVGKSSLVNALLGNSVQKVDSISEKAERGKNTTTRAEIIKLSENSYIIDTPGFSMLDLHDVEENELDLYYPEYVELSCECKYRRCSHTVEPDCKVRELSEKGTLNKLRYDRYLIMRSQLNNKKRF